MPPVVSGWGMVAIEMLKDCHAKTDRKKALGIDGMTKAEAEDLWREQLHNVNLPGAAQGQERERLHQLHDQRDGSVGFDLCSDGMGVGDGGNTRWDRERDGFRGWRGSDQDRARNIYGLSAMGILEKAWVQVIMHLDDCALIVRETEVMRMVEMTQHEKDLKAIAEFKLFDDTFMSAVFDGQIAETELLIRVVLGRDDIEAISSKAQYYITNIYGHEVRLDILAKDKEGKS